MPETAAKPQKRATAAPKPKAKAKGAASPAKASQPPKKTGRPSKHSPELVAEICDRISRGEPLLQICKDDRMPERRTVYDWLERIDGLSAQFARAREEGCDAIAEQSLAIMDGEPLAVFDEAGNKRYDSGSIAWNKNRAEHRLKLLACWNPQKYGSKVAVGGDPGNPVKVEIQSEADAYLATLLKNVELNKQVDANE
jgi:hypothetical protein